ncbi:MAG: peptidase C39 family protein [Candidatus Bathyarchaeia archaeon]
MNRRKICLLSFFGYLLISALPLCSIQTTSSSNFISVKYFSQETSYFCGPATIQMALGYLTDSYPSQDKIATEVQTNPETGVTYLDKMRIAFDNRGFNQVYETTLDLETLKTINSNGYLVIILIYFDTTYEYMHYVLVVGFDNSSVYVHDPWPTSQKQPQGRMTGENVSISNELLADLWNSEAPWALVIPYSPTQGAPFSWWKEYWYFLVIVSTVAAIVLALVLVRKTRNHRENQYPPGDN